MENCRIGQIVPSSNTTMETDIPAMLRAREAILPERLTFHSSRRRMKRVDYTYPMLEKLGLQTIAPHAGALLSGKY